MPRSDDYGYGTNYTVNATKAKVAPAGDYSFANLAKKTFGIGEKGNGYVGKALGMVAKTPLWLGKTYVSTVWEGAKQLGAGSIPATYNNLAQKGFFNPTKLASAQGRAELGSRVTDILDKGAPKWAKTIGTETARLTAPPAEQAFVPKSDYTTLEAITDIMNVASLAPGGSFISKGVNLPFKGVEWLGKQTLKTGIGKSLAAKALPAIEKLEEKFGVYASRAIQGKTGQYVSELVRKNNVLKNTMIGEKLATIGELFNGLKSQFKDKTTRTLAMRRIQEALDDTAKAKFLTTDAEKGLYTGLKGIYKDIATRLVGHGIITEDKLVKFGYNPRKIVLRVDGQDIKMGDILKPGTASKKSFENLMARNLETLGDVYAKGLDIEDDYGKTILNYVLASENIINRERTYQEIVEEFGEKVQGKLFGARKSLATGKKIASKGIDVLGRPKVTTVPLKGKKFFIDSAIDRDIRRYVTDKYYLEDGMLKSIVKVSDFANKLFKPLATTVSPRTTGFTDVNAIGNFFNSNLAGMHPLSIFKLLSSKNRGLLAKSGYKSGEDWLRSEFDLDLYSKGAGKASKVWGKVVKVMSWFNQRVENSAKDSLALDQLLKGKSTVEAKRIVDKYLFDYGDLSPFEQQVIKKLIPFYTWMRKNVPLQVENMIKQPEKYLKMVAFMHNLQTEADRELGVPTPKNQEGKAPWLMNPSIAGYEIPINGIRTPFRDEKGNRLIMKPRLPLEDVGEIANNPAKRLLSALGPVPKFLIEWRENKDVFTGKEIVPEGIGGTEKALLLGQKALKDFLPPLSYYGRFKSDPSTDRPSLIYSIVTGLRMYSEDIPQSLQIKDSQFNGKIKDIDNAAYGVKAKYENGQMYQGEYEKQMTKLADKHAKLEEEYTEWLKKAVELVPEYNKSEAAPTIVTKPTARPKAGVPKSWSK